MEVKIGITHNCELLVQGTEDSLEYVRIGNKLKELLDPYNSKTLSTEELRDEVNLILEPCTDYEGEVVFLEFVTGKDIDSSKNLIITEKEFNTYKYSLPKDGLYVYYKIALQKKEYMGNEYINKIYYDNGKIMYKDQEIKDPSELIDYLTLTGVGILDYCEEVVFSLCKLEHCVFEIQRSVLKAGLKTCGLDDCDKLKNIRDQRNFLFISLAVLKHLISEEKYDDAEEILEALSSCGSLCKDLNNSSKSCNCGTE